MSVAETQAWISSHKRKDNAVERWNAALADTKSCAQSVASMSGFAAATAYYNCRKGKKVAS
jgi:hypothetical protein